VNVLIIARLTLLEALRRRLLWALAGLTFAVVVLTGWAFALLTASARERAVPPLELVVAVSQLLILVAFMFSFVLAMTAAFLGAPAIAADLESGVLQAIVARPIRRVEIMVGKWLGLVAIVLAYAIVAGLLEVAAVAAVSGYLPPDPLSATLFLGGQAIVLLTIAMLLSTRLPTIAGGAVAVVLFGVSWISGVMGSIAGVLGLDALARTVEASRFIVPLDGLWKGAVYALEPPAFILLATSAGERAARVAANNPFYAAAPPAPVFLLYVGAWLAVVLGLAAWSFARREI
jgi:ABC-type transport system involved in multi-copper enzyme maturation permease subunit